MQNHSSYKIYITKSLEVSELIARGLREATPWSKKGGKTLGISCGPVCMDCRIPALYHESDFYFAMIEYRNGENWENQEYALVLC